MRKYEFLFFDLDRTLWDYDSNARKSFETIYKEYELRRNFKSADEFFRIYNIHNDRLWDDYRKGVIRKNDLRQKRFSLTLEEGGIMDEALAAEIDLQYMELTHRQVGTFPNTFPTLDYLKEKSYRLFILTNGFIKTQQKKMQYSRLEPYFERLFSSEEIGVNKPKADIFHWAVSSLNAPKRQCLMIGDDCAVDIRGARSYGIDAVWFNPNDQSSNCEASYTISDLSELRNIL